jgi:hypothetical protein
LVVLFASEIGIAIYSICQSIYLVLTKESQKNEKSKDGKKTNISNKK